MPEPGASHSASLDVDSAPGAQTEETSRNTQQERPLPAIPAMGSLDVSLGEIYKQSRAPWLHTFPSEGELSNERAQHMLAHAGMLFIRSTYIFTVLDDMLRGLHRVYPTVHEETCDVWAT